MLTVLQEYVTPHARITCQGPCMVEAECAHSSAGQPGGAWEISGSHLGNMAGSLAQRADGALHVSADARARLALLAPHQAGHQRHRLLGLQLLCGPSMGTGLQQQSRSGQWRPPSDEPCSIPVQTS